MAAAAQREDPERMTPAPEAKAAESGPVVRRAVLFSRLVWVIVGLSWISALAALPYLPEIIPVHWNLYGEPDGFAGRLWGAFSFPVILTLTSLLLILLPRFERMRVTFEDSRDLYAITIFATVSLIFGLEVTALLSSAGMDLPVAVLFMAFLGFFFIVLGGLMPHIRRNTTLGIRLPWTIRSERVWDETHRHGGKVLVIAGVLVVLVSTAGGAPFMPLAFGILALAFLYITAWSYQLARAEKGQGAD